MNKPVDDLRGILTDRFKGTANAFNLSINTLIKEMRRDLGEITDPEAPSYNGVSIKDPKLKAEKLEMALKPVLKAAENIFNAACKNNGWSSEFQITERKDEEDFGGAKINLIETNALLSAAISEWLARVAQQKDLDPKPGLPLPPTHPARLDPISGVDNLREIMYQTTDGNKPYKHCEFATNEHYAQIFEDYRKTVAAAPVAGK